MKVEQGERVIGLFFMISPPTTISIKRSGRYFSIDMDIFKNNQIKLFPCFTVIPRG